MLLNKYFPLGSSKRCRATYSFDGVTTRNYTTKTPVCSRLGTIETNRSSPRFPGISISIWKVAVDESSSKVTLSTLNLLSHGDCFRGNYPSNVLWPANDFPTTWPSRPKRILFEPSSSCFQSGKTVERASSLFHGESFDKTVRDNLLAGTSDAKINVFRLPRD